VSPIDALSALTQGQMPDATALNGMAGGALGNAFNGTMNGALNNALGSVGSVGGAINANPLPGATSIGLTAPVSESFAQALSPLQSLASSSTVAPSGSASPTTWGHMVQQMVMDTNNQQANANAMVSDVLKGGPTPVHQAMIATEEASLSFDFLAEARNKVLDAYNQVMQMQV
jgi:flagellar hook-basal body complex protein FliE